MIILNPSYDLVFKYLMENAKIAKKIISVTLDTEIESMELLPQETSLKIHEEDAKIVRSLRMDFIAKIKTASGDINTVMIELQKVGDPNPIVRFRKYLGRTYMKHETREIIKADKTYNEYFAYPIVTIYFLGYNLHGVDSPVVRVNPSVFDVTKNVTMDVKNEFIEQLNHRSHIIQLKRLRKDRITRIEKLLSLFDQSKTVDGNDMMLDVKDIDDEFRDVADYLHLPVNDEKFIREMEYYEEVENSFSQKRAEINEMKIELIEKEKTIEDNKKSLEEKDKSLEEKDKEIEEKDRYIQELLKQINKP